jgi:hypothetical protein
MPSLALLVQNDAERLVFIVEGAPQMHEHSPKRDERVVETRYATSLRIFRYQEATETVAPSERGFGEGVRRDDIFANDVEGSGN